MLDFTHTHTLTGWQLHNYTAHTSIKCALNSFIYLNGSVDQNKNSPPNRLHSFYQQAFNKTFSTFVLARRKHPMDKRLTANIWNVTKANTTYITHWVHLKIGCDATTQLRVRWFASGSAINWHYHQQIKHFYNEMTHQLHSSSVCHTSYKWTGHNINIMEDKRQKPTIITATQLKAAGMQRSKADVIHTNLMHATTTLARMKQKQ